MSEPDRPPLNPIMFELIDQTLHKIDMDYLPVLAARQVGLQIGVPESLRVPKSPALLLNTLCDYAGALFRAEANNYEELRKGGTYPAWLSRLADRIAARVLKVVEDVDRMNIPASLKYHGVTEADMRDHLKEFLAGAVNRYAWKDSGPMAPTPSPQPETPVSPPQPASAPLTRSIAQQLKDLQDESRMTVEEMAEAIEIEPRSVFRHLSGDSIPRAKQIGAFERLFTDKLGRPVRLETSGKRQRIKSKRS
jgi:hypothetical protein